MSEFDKLLHQVTELDPVQREQFLFVLSVEFYPELLFAPRLSKSFRQEFPSIVSTPGVCVVETPD